MLYKQVIRDEAVLAELNFDSDAVLNKISLVVRKDRSVSRLLDRGLLLWRGKAESLAYEIVIVGYPVACTTLLPPSISEIAFESGVKLDGSVKQFAAHPLFFADLGFISLGINSCNNALDFFPDTWFVDEEPFMTVEVRVQPLNFQGCSARNLPNSIHEDKRK